MGNDDLLRAVDRNSMVDKFLVQVFEGAVILHGNGRRQKTITQGLKSLVPANTNEKILINRVKNAAKNNPHVGSDIEKLTTIYLNKIEVRGRTADAFTIKPVSNQANDVPVATTTSVITGSNSDNVNTVTVVQVQTITPIVAAAVTASEYAAG